MKLQLSSSAQAQREWQGARLAVSYWSCSRLSAMGRVRLPSAIALIQDIPMNTQCKVLVALLLVLVGAQLAAAKSMQEVLAESKPADWRALDPANTLYMELERGRVIIELAPQFAPKHVANIRSLVRQQYFDAQRINRSQDNF